MLKYQKQLLAAEGLWFGLEQYFRVFEQYLNCAEIL